jgi:protein O-mannosyl-transferase
MTASSQPERFVPLKLGLLIFLGFLFYEPALDAGFVWDDNCYVTDNYLLWISDGMQRIWFSLNQPSQYFPLTYTVLRWEYALWGLNPVGYHFVNVLFHILNAIVLFYLLRKLKVPGAWFASAIFLLHPVQVETVAWVTELKNLLSTFFYLLGLVFWIQWIDGLPKDRWKWFALTFACFLCALFSKTVACTFPAALLLILWWKNAPATKKTIALVVPFIIAGLSMGLVSMWIEANRVHTTGPEFEFSSMEKLLRASHALWFYPFKLLLPLKLTFSYPRSDTPSYLWLLSFPSLAVLLLILLFRWGRKPTVAVLFYVAAILPLLGFINCYTFRYSFVADHYQYLPCAGLIALLAGVLTSSIRSPWFSRLTMACVLLFLGSLTWNQCHIYKNKESLWRDTLQKNPQSWMALNNLGAHFVQQNRIDEAKQFFQAAINIKPDYSDAHHNLAVLLEPDDFQAAKKEYFLAIRLKPDFPQTYDALGTAFLARGEIDRAVKYIETAIHVEPLYAAGYLRLGRLYSDQRLYDKSIAVLREGISRRSESIELRHELGLVLLKKGDPRTAREIFKEALQLKPDAVDIQKSLALAEQQVR